MESVQLAPAESEQGKIVVRYADGRLLKGHIRDFYPNKPHFHLFPVDGPSDKAVEVRFKDLKAVFFVAISGETPRTTSGRSLPKASGHLVGRWK